MTWDIAIRVIAPEAARRSSYPEGAGNRNARSPPCRSYPTDLPVALRSAGFSPKGRWTAVREDAAAGGARIEAGRGGRKGWSSLPSALRFAIGEWFVAPRRVAGSYPFCAAHPRKSSTLSAMTAPITCNPSSSASGSPRPARRNPFRRDHVEAGAPIAGARCEGPGAQPV
jgi:hypothetical protein